MPPAPRLKFGNIPTVIDGLHFASRAEAKRYGELLLTQRAGMITNIVCQPKFQLVVNGVIIATYVADFSYHRGERLVVEDVKSPVTKTAVYRLKKRLMKALLDIEVVEIESKAATIARARRKTLSR